MVREDNDSAVFTATSGPHNDLDAWARRLVGNDPERVRYSDAMRRLARLSRDPHSLARDSEGNIWGFGADA